MADVLDKNQIGSILSGGGAWPPVGDDGKAWAEEINTSSSSRWTTAG